MNKQKTTNAVIIAQTKLWLESIIVKNNFCPFARRELERDSIRYCVISSPDITEGLQSLILECEHLDADKTIETTLLIYAVGNDDFNDFLDLLALAEDLLLAQGYEGIYQLASFHPEYIFAQVEASDPANFTNRSPYPMLHLLREQSIARALKFYPNPENIPQKNVALARQMGAVKMQKLLQSCYKSKSGT